MLADRFCLSYDGVRWSTVIGQHTVTCCSAFKYREQIANLDLDHTDTFCHNLYVTTQPISPRIETIRSLVFWRTSWKESCGKTSGQTLIQFLRRKAVTSTWKMTLSGWPLVRTYLTTVWQVCLVHFTGKTVTMKSLLYWHYSYDKNKCAKACRAGVGNTSLSVKLSNSCNQLFDIFTLCRTFPISHLATLL